MRLMPLPRSYLTGNRTVELLVVTLACLVAADVVINGFPGQPGFGFEANPLLQFWVRNNYFVLLKMVSGGLVALLLWDMHKRHLTTILVTTVCLVDA
jgi:hypothetical protein